MASRKKNNMQLDQQLCFALYRASQAVTASYRVHLAEVGLTYTQFLVLLVLWESGETTVGKLSAQLGLDSGTLTPLLKRLEQRGLVSRRRSSDDERVVCIDLTEDGRALRAPVDRARMKVASDTGLDMDEVVQLRSELQRLWEHMEDREANP